jgi:MFS family permease
MGGSLSYVAADVGGASKSSWLPVSNTLAIAAVAPFSGYLQDLIGRRNITLVGGLILIVGIILVGTAHRFGQAVTGMTLAGAGAGIAELTALAGWVDFFPPKSGPFSICR